MANGDTIDIEILDDGTVKITTGAISAPNHKNADEMIRAIQAAVGGDVTTERRRSTHTHVTATVKDRG